MQTRKVLLSILGILVLVGGFVAGLILIRQRQSLEQQAAVPGGRAKVSIFPTSGNFNVNETFPVSVFFNTDNIAISAVTVKLRYPYSGTTPEVSAGNIQVNSVLESSGNWNCPSKTVTAEGGNVNIDIACANISANGFSTGSDTLLATFDLTVGRTPTTNPLTISFDPSQSIITQKSNGQDILLIPDTQTGTAVYTIGGTSPGTTVSPTTPPTVTATTAPGVTTTLTPTATKTPTPTAVVTSATKGGLPDAGIGAPTIAGVGAGILLIIGALVLAL